MKQEFDRKRYLELLTLKKMRAVHIADITGISKASISRYFSGAVEPNEKVMKVLAEAIQVDVEEIVKAPPVIPPKVKESRCSVNYCFHCGSKIVHV